MNDAKARLLARQQYISYQLDILCATDATKYPHLTPGHSSYYKWLLDCLAVLAEGGAFTATEEELREIKAQAAFEVQRKSGAERRCKIDW